MTSLLSGSASPLPSPALEVMMGPVPESCRRSFIRGLTTWIMEDYYQRFCDRRIHSLMLSTLLGRTLLSISFLLTGVLCEGGVLGLVTEVREDSVLCHGFNPMLIFLRVLSLLVKSNVKNVTISINTLNTIDSQKK